MLDDEVDCIIGLLVLQLIDDEDDVVHNDVMVVNIELDDEADDVLCDEVDANEYLYFVIQVLADMIYLDDVSMNVIDIAYIVLLQIEL
jgi:hypothetical protein